jgi:hypothetical protein
MQGPKKTDAGAVWYGMSHVGLQHDDAGTPKENSDERHKDLYHLS